VKRRYSFSIVVLSAALICLLLWYRWHSAPRASDQAELQSALERGGEKNIKPGPEFAPHGKPSSAPVIPIHQTPSPVKDLANKAYLAMWRTPLLYYGKVVDETNRPIPGVQVHYGGNSIDESLTKDLYNEGATTTDESGLFKISGMNGIGLMFQLSHPDYYAYPENTTGFDVRSPPKDGILPDSETTATIFRMHHKGNPVPLIERHGGMHGPADGTVLNFPLRGQTHTEVIGHLEVQAWKGQIDPSTGDYDWRIKLAMPNGGAVVYTNRFAFTAPDAGYAPTFQLSVSKDAPQWSATASVTLFFKFPNYYARGEMTVDLSHDLYFTLNYFVNPDGSANLESDPNRP
jgi:hypothetical protein